MELKPALLDTNAILDFFAGKLNFSDFVQPPYFVSVITVIELLSYPELQNAERERILGFLRECECLELTQPVVDATIEMRSRHRLKIPDAIIAATALAHKLPLVSRDAAFGRVDGLDWKRLASDRG